MTLALTVPLGPTETATGFASRLALRNGCEYVLDFVQDMGLTWREIIRGETEALAILADLGGIEPGRLARYGIRDTGYRTRHIGSEVVTARLMRLNRQHVCPVCLATPGPVPAPGSVLWQFQAVRSCPHHEVALIALPEAEWPRCHHDLAGRIVDHQRLIDEASAAPQPLPITAFDRYFAQRALGQSPQQTWLDTLDLHTVWRACETLGMVLQHGAQGRVDLLTPDALARAVEAGFLALEGGPIGLHAAMQEVHEQQQAERNGFTAEFGLFAGLVQKRRKHGRAEVLVNAVREFIERTYPVAEGEDVLGRPCTQRRIHSVQSAAQTYRLNHTRTNRVFSTIANMPGHLGLPPPRQHLFVDAVAWGPWLSRYARTIHPKAAAKRLGIHFSTLKRIVAAGLLTPAVTLPGFVDRYDTVDIDGFLDRLCDGALLLDRLEPDMVSILSAGVRCGRDATQLLQLIQDRKLSFVGRLTGHVGLAALAVRPEEVRAVCAIQRPGGIRGADLQRALGINNSAAAYLFSTGMLRFKVERDPCNGRQVRFALPEDLEAFEQEYISLSKIARLRKTLPKHAANQLRRRGVAPITMPKHCSKIYRLADIDLL